jgi:hypothetical protein
MNDGQANGCKHTSDATPPEEKERTPDCCYLTIALAYPYHTPSYFASSTPGQRMEPPPHMHSTTSTPDQLLRCNIPL